MLGTQRLGFCRGLPTKLFVLSSLTCDIWYSSFQTVVYSLDLVAHYANARCTSECSCTSSSRPGSAENTRRGANHLISSPVLIARSQCSGHLDNESNHYSMTSPPRCQSSCWVRQVEIQEFDPQNPGGRASGNYCHPNHQSSSRHLKITNHLNVAHNLDFMLNIDVVWSWKNDDRQRIPS